MNPEDPATGQGLRPEATPLHNLETRFCTNCHSPLAGDNSSNFCPVCMLRSALADAAAADNETAAAFSEFGREGHFEHYQLATDENGKPVELGRGAMGITYKALDTQLRCTVALKVINDKYLGDTSARLRFLREARAAARIRHPNLASVFHLGQVGGNYFYTMEFVDGETLENLILRQGRLGIKRALDIVSQLGAGLAAVHKEGLVHRDIKPSNIMVCFDEADQATAKIIDLGLAKQVREPRAEAAISLPGGFAGTPEFASPEQFVGGDIDIRADLYSLGLTLWAMIAGEPPFTGSPAEVMVQQQDASLPVERLDDTPQPVVALLEVLLKKDPARRFQTPTEFLGVLPLVRGAIVAKRPVLETIRIQISTGRDTQKERNLADRLMHSIGAELGLPVSDSQLKPQRLAEHFPDSDDTTEIQERPHSPLILCCYFEESHKLQSETKYPTASTQLAEFDLVICIVWARLGTVLSSLSATPNAESSTAETEFGPSLPRSDPGINRGGQLLHVFRNCSKPTPPLEPKEDREAFGRHWDSVAEFFASWERTSGRSTATSLSNYDRLEEFEEIFRERFRTFVAHQLTSKVGPENSDKKIRRWLSSPFRGLNVFDFEHAGIFYGRTKAIGDVLEALDKQLRAQRPFVLVVGASGSGKSSLIRAGVLPLLAQPETIGGIGLWRWAVTRPGAGGSGGDCFDALAASLLEPAALPVLQDLESRDAVRSLAQELREHSSSLALRVRDALDHAARGWKSERSRRLAERECHLRESERPAEADLIQKQNENLEMPKARLALVVDQLEELFTSGFSIEIRQNYISAIAGLVRSGRVFVLAALRSDFYPSYQEHPELTELTEPSGKFDLRPPSPFEIGSMIRLPAEAAGLRFESERRTGERLDEALRDAASTTPESLPLLEHILSLLYDKQAVRGDGLLRWSDYKELGELKGALARHAECIYAALQPHEQSAFPLAMRYLVALGQGEEEVPNRRTVPYRDFMASEGSELDDKESAKGFVDLFIENRLLVVDTDPQGEVTVSVAHEALLREWQRVKDWLAENRDFLRMRGRLDASRKLWLERGKQKDDLLRPGLPLAEGEKLEKDFGPSLSREQKDYVDASIEERRIRDRARERARYLVMAGVTTALIVAIIFAVVSYRQYRRAERAKVSADEAAKLATRARNEAEKLITFMSIDLRDKLNPIGRLDLLEDVNQKVQAYYRAFVASEDTPETLRQRSIVLINYGDIRKYRGDLVGALESYRSALVTQKILTNKDPKNADWQHDLASSLENVGDVLTAQGKNEEGLENYRQSLAIRETITAQNPGNSVWQGELASSYEDLGEVLSAQRGYDGALQYYRKALAIREKLASEAPDNLHAKRSIFRCFAAIGYALNARGDRKEALDIYRKSLEITKALTGSDPSDTNLQRDLSIGLERIGDVLQAEGDLSGALDSYRDSLGIRQKLANRDPTNSLWQSDVAWSYQEIGDVLTAQGDIQAALGSYENSLTIFRGLTKQDPTNRELQNNLAVILEKTGETLLAQRDFSKALETFRDSLAICEKRTPDDLKNAEWASAEALAHLRIALTLTQITPTKNTEVHSMLARARDILLDLKKRSALSAPDQEHLEQIQTALANL
jgi:serine/threonine protein kinase/tetratricopeptide (TPR) repeat protein